MGKGKRQIRGQTIAAAFPAAIVLERLGPWSNCPKSNILVKLPLPVLSRGSEMLHTRMLGRLCAAIEMLRALRRSAFERLMKFGSAPHKAC